MFDQILANFKTKIEAITPDTRGREYGASFEHYSGDVAEAPATAASDRRFSIIPDDGIEILGDISANATVRFQKVIWVIIQYRIGQDLTTFLGRLHQDVDRLCYTLRLPSSYASGDDWALLLRTPAGAMRWEPDDNLTSALCYLPFEVTYSVTYS